jgi:hypothetical protein
VVCARRFFVANNAKILAFFEMNASMKTLVSSTKPVTAFAQNGEDAIVLDWLDCGPQNQSKRTQCTAVIKFICHISTPT